MNRPYRIIKDLEPWDPIPDAPLQLLALAEPKQRPTPQPSAASGSPVDAALLREALGWVPPDTDYETWRNRVAAVGAANCAAAREIAHEWSRGELDRDGRFKDGPPAQYLKGGADAVDLVLDTMPPKEAGIGVGSINKEAQDAGWPKTLAPRPAASETFKEAIAALAAEETRDPAPSDSYPAPKLASELATGSFPVPFYLWQGFILAEHVNTLYGDGGAGKTRLALMIAVASAAGIALFGYETMQMPGLVVLAEDDYGATQKLLAEICGALGVTLADLPLRVWCLPGADARIAVVQDDGTWTPGPFLAPLRGQIDRLGGRVLVVLDTVSDVATLDETKRLAVNTLCKQALGGLCRDFGATVIVNAHPSKAAMADGSGYAGSTAWNNAVRSRLTLERDKEKSPRRMLRVAKSNYGSEAELELHMVNGIFWPRDQGDAAELNDRLMAACVVAALAAAEQGTPIQPRQRPPRWVFNEIERDAGKRPTWPQLKEVLADAQRAGRIRHLKGTTKRMAGYYPWDEERAADLAREAKRHAAQVEVLSATAASREATRG